MSDRTAVLGGRCVLGVTDVARARAFWCDGLGFGVVVERADALVLRAGDAELAVEPAAAPTPVRVVLHVRGVEGLRDRAVAHGGRVVAALHTHDSGRRDVELADPDGHRVRLVEDERVGGRVAGLSLAVGAPEASLAFWRAVAGFDAGGAGLAGDGRPVASVAFAHGTPAAWLVHFAVDDMEEALAEVTARGGRVVVQGEALSVVQDPNGAVAALVPG